MSGLSGHPAGTDWDLPPIDEDLKDWLMCLSGPRLEVLVVLSHGPMCVGDIAARLCLDYTCISRALGNLRKLRCVCDDRCGRKTIYQLSPAVRVESEANEIAIHIKLPRSRRATLWLPAPAPRGDRMA